VAVSTRHGGVSEGPYESLNLGLHVGDDDDRVVANRQRVVADFGGDPQTTVYAQQVHGAGISLVNQGLGGRGFHSVEDALPDTDVLVATDGGITLCILVADCLPVALIDPEARVLAVVHAGWRGTAAGVVRHAVAAMCEQGGQPERIVAYFGPAVAPSDYQVDEVVVRGLVEAAAPHPLDPAAASPDGDGHWLVDLPAANRQQLALVGLEPDCIIDCGATTANADYFSDRAQRPCGRFAMMARLSP
jgi:hypothetical protein